MTTTVSYALDTPPAAALRGGDCRARDLNQARNVHGGHRFAATTHCRISNGLLRLTVGATGAAPALTIAARRGALPIGDYLSDILSDTLPGTTATPAWFAMGTLTIDSPSVSALLTGVRIAHVTAESVTLRLIAPAIGDAWVTLERGERQVHVQHGSTRAPLVDIDRRIRLTSSPSPVGTAALGRVEEMVPATEGFRRFVAAVDPVTANAGAFLLTAVSMTTARFGFGVGTGAIEDRPLDMHRQLRDSSRPLIVLT